MQILRARPYAGEADLQPIADLLNACEAVDQLDAGTSVAELRLQLGAPSLDLAQDLCVWEEVDGQLVAFGKLWVPELGEQLDGGLSFDVHPRRRGSSLETQVIAWGEARMREVGREHGAKVKLRSGSRTDRLDRLSLLEGHGFTAERYFFEMGRSLAEPIAEPRLPVGFSLRTLEGQPEVEAWVELFNQSFIDHWNHHELTVESLRYWLDQDPHYRPDLNLLAVAADGTFAAFCVSQIDPEENRRSGRNEGWVADLGTRRGFRRLGLGRAMLLAGLQRLKAAGVNTAKLGVDSENPSGALKLYESVGFRKLHTSASYVKAIQ